MELWRYRGQIVSILFTDGGTFVGYVDIYHDEEDTANGIAALTCIPLGGDFSIALDIEAHEIAKIEIVTTKPPINI